MYEPGDRNGGSRTAWLPSRPLRPDESVPLKKHAPAILACLLTCLLVVACVTGPIALDSPEKFIAAVEGRTLVLTGGNHEHFTRDGQVRVIRPDGSLVVAGQWRYEAGRLCKALNLPNNVVEFCVTPRLSGDQILADEVGGLYAIMQPR